MKAMEEEISSLKHNCTWILSDKPKFQKIIGYRWLFKRKLENTLPPKLRYKARLVVKGYTQREGIDVTEVFSSVVKHCSIRIMLSIVTQFDLQLHQLDVKTTFLHGDLEEVLYMSQPPGFVETGCE